MKKNIKLLFAVLMALAFTVPSMASNQSPVFKGNDCGYVPINFNLCDEVGTRSQVIDPVTDLAVMTGKVINSTTLEPTGEVVIGDESDYASFVPVYGTDINVIGTKSQMIYSADKLTDMVGTEVLSLKFFTKDEVKMDGGVIQLSLKIVDDPVFAEETPATELTAVATVSPVLNGTDLEFTFDQPYTYNGGNLLVDCTVIEAGTSNYQPTHFYGNPSDINVSLYYYDDYGVMTTDFVPFLPKALFTYKKGAAPEVKLGDVNGDGQVNISDVTALIDYLLSDDASGVNLSEADCNRDGSISISDVTALIDYLLNGSWD